MFQIRGLKIKVGRIERKVKGFKRKENSTYLEKLTGFIWGALDKRFKGRRIEVPLFSRGRSFKFTSLGEIFWEDVVKKKEKIREGFLSGGVSNKVWFNLLG